MVTKQPGNGAEKLEKLPEPELKPVLQEPGTAQWLWKMITLLKLPGALVDWEHGQEAYCLAGLEWQPPLHNSRGRFGLRK